ncbi:MAG: hypothetical protein H6Q25_441 [Bacteroidetes bacterium]|nr:hypothetical protein [Bacteroidota bacterium]
MKEIVLITGGSGLIASNLARLLSPDYSIRFLSRQKNKENDFIWDLDRGFLDPSALIGVDHIIHLAGANISGQRWTKTYKNEIINSRKESAELILNTLQKNGIRIKSFISASAIGYYDALNRNLENTEEAPKGVRFLSDVVDQWEQCADRFFSTGIADRVVKIRTGVVLDSQKGALPKIVLPIKFFLGAHLGDGKQYFPWIHIQDICNLYKYVIENRHLEGVYNGVAPHHITNEELTKEISKILKKPLFMPNIPPIILHTLFGEASSLLLEGSKVSSYKIEKEGFQFQFNRINKALENLLT